MKVAVLALALLSGCAGTMPQERRITADDDPSNPCFDAIASRQDLSPIATQIPLSAQSPRSFDLLTSSARPTEPEKAALSKWANYRLECAQLGAQFRQQYGPPGWASAMHKGHTAVIEAISRLYAGEITYGQFNAERERIAANTDGELQATLTEASRAEQTQASAESIRRLQALQIMQSMQPRQAVPAPAAPVFCNSSRNGNQISTTCR